MKELDKQGVNAVSGGCCMDFSAGFRMGFGECHIKPPTPFMGLSTLAPNVFGDISLCFSTPCKVKEV